MRTPISVAVRLLPIDQLSSGVCAVMPVAVALGDEPPLPGHDEGRGHRRRRLEGRVDRLLHLAPCRAPAGSGSVGSTSPIGHGCVDGVGQRALRRLTGVKLTASLPDRQRDASLARRGTARCASTPFGSVTCTALAARSITGLPSFARSSYGAGEVADVLGGEVGIEPGDEHRRAHDLGEAGGVVLERVARRRHVRRVELERLRPRDQRIVRAAQGGREVGRGRRGPHPREYTEVGDAAAPYTWSNSGLTGRARR